MSNMVKTTKAMCRKCKHSTNVSTTIAEPVCNYILDTKQRRDCPLGYCDKYEEGKRKGR